LREKLLALVDLQKVDMEIASLRKAAEVWPKQLAELEKELASAQSAVEAERNRVLDLESQKRTLEQTISEEKEKVKKWEQRLAEQRSTREYSALAREIDIAKKATVTMQEEVVDLGKQLGAAREAVTARETETSGTRQRINASITELRSKMENSESQVAGLNVKREEEATKVDPALLRRYDTVRKKRMPAMVAVVNGRCTGCNMNIPPQLNYLLHASRGTDVCPSCNRIIHAAEALEPKPES
jgi:predicted  nucleic acid-binding Zn-ribbon protein